MNQIESDNLKAPEMNPSRICMEILVYAYAEDLVAAFEYAKGI